MASIPEKYQKYVKSVNYFDPGNSCHTKDKDLYEDILEEVYNIHGIPVTYYVTSYNTSYDRIFGEDNNRRFVRRFALQVYYELPKEEEVWTKFGIEGLDNFHAYSSKQHFATYSTSTSDGRLGAFSSAFSMAYDRYYPAGTELFDVYAEYTPKVGDIFKAEYNDRFYEIVDVGEEEEMFLQGKHAWDFIVKPYKDEHLTLSGELSATEVSGVSNLTDTFSISSTIDSEKGDILYDQPDSETSPNDPFGGW